MWNPQNMLRRRKAPRDRAAISRGDAERLLDGSPTVDAEHAVISAVLAAVAGPAQPHELVGEREALAAFSRAYRSRSHPRPEARRPGLRMGIAVASAVAVLLVAGTGYAAGTGRLPDALQHTLHDLLPGAGTPTPAGLPTTRPAAPGSAGSAPSPSASAASDVPIDVAQQLRLCQSWMAFRADPHARPVSAGERRALALAAGGENAINDFCQRLLNPTPTPTATTVKPGNPDPGNGKPSHPAKPSRT
jgi:hypothetical protein